MTIAQIVYDNELHFGYSHEEIHEKVPHVSISINAPFPYALGDEYTFPPSVMLHYVPCGIMSSILTVMALPTDSAYMERHG